MIFRSKTNASNIESKLVKKKIKEHIIFAMEAITFLIKKGVPTG